MSGSGPLLGEISVLDDVGPPRRGRAYPATGATVLLLLPAMLLVVGLVLWPVAHIVLASVTDQESGRVLTLAHYRTALTGPDALPVIVRTLLWAIVVPLVITVMGYVLALASRRLREGPLIRLILLIPIAVPLAVAGITFRLMYDPDPDRGLATLVAARVLGRTGEDLPLFLGPSLITIALMSAFVWAWVGLTVVVFRAALDTIPANLTDAVHAHGGNRWDALLDGQWRPLLLRTSAVVFVLVALGTTRTFDLVLVMAPGSVRDEASVLALKVWETSGGTVSGPAAALGVLWLLAVAVGIPLAGYFIRRPWPAPAAAAPAIPAPRPVPIWSPRRLLAAAAAIAWLIPIIVLIAVSLRGPADAARPPWWDQPIRIDSYHAALNDAQLQRSLLLTFGLALVVTVAVLLVALLAAYPLAWLTGPVARGAGWALLAATIVPIQIIAGPVNEVLGQLWSTGTTRGLALVHIAQGVPIAVLLLRNAFADLPAGQLRPVRPDDQPRWRAVWRLVRLQRTTIIAVMVLQFVQVWNDLVIGLLFGGPNATPVGLFLYGQTRQFVSNSGGLAASSLLVSVLPVLLVLLTRRQLVSGLISGRMR